MRLFAAVLPPEDVTAALAAEVAALRKLPGAEGLRWTGRPGWHLTLAFYGEVDDDLVPDLSARLERAAHRTAPFGLALRGGGQFGHGRALWAGVEGDLATLRLLADRAESAGRRAGVERGEHRRYKPHLSVARSRNAYDVRPYVEALDAFTSPAWTVTDLALVRSNLPRSGVPGEQPRYETVARSPLGASG
ncbi:RNA 2',3'-cyclic phosphodiesterase [Streptomyces rochei]|uniref:RNA 2',3'-cyclic phosphodiesterase n=1 Tax=Streptomyces TaxID=1883 RepID=UPI0004C7F203|nr:MULTISPECIES: RNA 2',3'-cyclic phosphodiesterase [Streptomyces]MDV6289398.1 RNA 2',3'-cyclic phosphodiesterase [Streptomyces sp. UP1A-1]MBX4176780.1 RNA 2',3'-cyclic phosphodiesterase [Streptomyces geysiriensis]MDI3099378.1 RNA 2',3'-cyclic phosphodiesterase [Streptomyces sp. AN-3]WMI58755.1 RNA 2',3'-cyclic phosphodiesterase [Streptomyces rochei]WQC13478.1 RNA 2',3'-cyclic phosphodiesterase [Streptomyces rochei]